MCWAWIYSPGNINGKSSLPLKIHLTMLFVLLHISLLRHPRPGWTVCSEQPINHQIKWKNTEDKTRRTLRSFVHLTTSKLAHQYLTHSQQIFFFLLLPSFWRCFMTFHVSLLLCFAILTVTKFPIKFGLNLSRYHETYWKKMSLAFSFDHKSREKVSCKKKTDVRKSFGSLQPEYQVKEKSRSEMSCSGSARLQKGQQHHHLLEGVNLANVPVATKGGVRNAFGRYAA